MPNQTTRELCERRLTGMKAVRKPYEADWDEIARMCMPTRPELLSSGNTTTRAKRRANTGMYSSRGRRAARTLTAGMTSGLSSPSRPWFKLETRDPDMLEYEPVKEWIAQCERLIYDFLARTNFYNAVKIGYAELGCFGTEACVMLEHQLYGAVCHTLTAGEYWIANDDGLVADTLYRYVPMTVNQVVQAFFPQGGWGVMSSQVKNAYDKGEYEQVVKVWHAIEPNRARQPGKIDSRNMAWRSIWWEEGQTKKDVLLRSSGFDDKPFWAPRWAEVGGSVVYGDGPGYDALPDLRELQLAAKRLGRSIDMLNRPPIVLPTGMSNTFVSLDPGAVSYAAPADIGVVKPIFEPDYRAPQAIREAKEEHGKDVDAAFYADLFNAITDMEGVPPRNEQELSLRNDEKLTQLGPVVERVNVEKLEVAIDRAFSILQRTGQLPPAPDELQGHPLQIDFISVLAQAQRATALDSIQRIAQFTGFLAGVFPGAADKFDADAAIDAFATGIGTPPKIVRTEQMVQQIRDQQAQQQQAQQAAAMAKPAADAAQAAQLLSQTNVGGQPMLDRLAA